jgi:hypothetical protein
MPDNDFLRQTNMLIRHYCPGVDPDCLSDEEWATMARDVQWFLKTLKGNG